MNRSQAGFLLHATVVVFGFTGILGKLIALPAVPLVFWRTLIGALACTVDDLAGLLPAMRVRCAGLWR